MKLAICKSNSPTLAEEKLSMNRFNISRIMNNLARSVLVMMWTISIPSCVFRAIEYMFHNARYSATQAVEIVLDSSVAMIFNFTKYCTFAIGILTLIKFLKTGDSKQLGKDVLAIMISYFFVNLFKYIPYVLPVIAKALNLF